MAFLDKVSDFGKTVAKKSGEAVDTAKIKIKISDRKSNIKDLKVQMGTSIYEDFEAESDVNVEALKELYVKIKEEEAAIAELEASL
ncbi:MAG: hypothetical protein IKT25_05935 [Firmicutes bacterium]|nr:hypothetical protein [Bacillota bacterium]